MRIRLASVALAAVSSLLGFVLLEAGYRVYLRRTQPWWFLNAEGLWYFEKSPFRYSEAFGYEYVPGSYHGGAAHDGRIIACWDPFWDWEINAEGNSGRIAGRYAEAELRILAFGDSFTQRPRPSPAGEPMTWPNFLQDLLEAELGRSVHVVNFGRDGYGVLQMLDLAAAKVPEWRPDLAILAFITDDLARGRFWRITTVLDGRERILVSSVPDPHPRPEAATDAYLVDSRATSEWCHRLLASQARGDPVLRDLEEALREGRRRSSHLSDAWSLSQSFALDALLHGQPFHGALARATPSQKPLHGLADFADDPRAVAAVEALRASGTPIVLLHLASHPELAAGEEYSDRGADPVRDRALVESLERLTGWPVHETLAHLPAPLGQIDLESLPVDAPRDVHPSLRGHRFYAEVAATVLRRHGFAE
jgi:hypothetical protein